MFQYFNSIFCRSWRVGGAWRGRFFSTILRSEGRRGGRGGGESPGTFRRTFREQEASLVAVVTQGRVTRYPDHKAMVTFWTFAGTEPRHVGGNSGPSVSSSSLPNAALGCRDKAAERFNRRGWAPSWRGGYGMLQGCMLRSIRRVLIDCSCRRGVVSERRFYSLS